MNELFTINQAAISIKEYSGKRVVTFKDIDTVHHRPEGTARRNFNSNKAHFVEGEDFYKIQPNEIRTVGITSPNGGIVVTESGYYMLVKSFTDELSWDVQRQLVNGYFRANQMQSMISDLSPQLQALIQMETRQKQLEAKQAQQDTAIADLGQRLTNTCEVIALDKNSWRKDTQHMIAKIATATGDGCGNIRQVYEEIYKAVESRAGVALNIRLTNKRNRMAGEGVCRSKIEKLNKVDIIAEDKKLIEIYVAIVKELAVKYGVCA